MKRFSTLAEATTHNYSQAEISAMSDAELVEEINSLPDWDGDLLADLIWRAFPDFSGKWEVGDPICYQAAEKLGFEI